MCLAFEYEGVPLKENGCDIPVTNGNREEYVEAVTKYILEKSIFTQFKSFKEGFLKASLRKNLSVEIQNQPAG